VDPPASATTRQFDEQLAGLEDGRYELTLFVSGASELSVRAIANARQLFDLHLPGRYTLSVIDVHEDPAALIENRILAAPTLVRSLPLPMRRLVGDLSQTERVLHALGIPLAHTTPAPLG
jgi:circadian clock protein KaiB